MSGIFLKNIYKEGAVRENNAVEESREEEEPGLVVFRQVECVGEISDPA